MSNGRGKRKATSRRRTTKTSKGLHRHGKHPLTEVQKTNVGKGIALEPFGEPTDSYRKWYEALQRRIEARWEAEQKRRAA